MALKTGTDDWDYEPTGATQNSQEKLTRKLTPFSTDTAFSGCNGLATAGNEQGKSSEKDDTGNRLNRRHLGSKNDRLATVGTGKIGRGGGRIRTDDNGFAIRRLGPLGYAANLLQMQGLQALSPSLSCLAVTSSVIILPRFGESIPSFP